MTAPRGGTVAIVQARMTSSRLPGKVLLPLHGQPMIIQQLERMKRATTLDSIVVATSTDSSDDELVKVLSSAGYAVERGSLSDVLARYSQVIEKYEPAVVVRITADCPLIDPGVIDFVVHSFNTSGADYVSNTMEPTFPDGMDVEVVRPEALRYVHEHSTDPHEREHVTLGVYRRPEIFTIQNVVDPLGDDSSSLRWTVDNHDDYTFVSNVYRELSPIKSDFDYEDVLRFLSEHPQLMRTNSHAQRNAALNGLDTGVMRHMDEGGS